MIKIKDELFLGFISGIVANVVVGTFEYIFYLMGFVPYLRVHIAASLFIPESQVKTIPAEIIGYFTDYTLAILLGVILVYVLKNTGYDYSLVKGISVGLLAWVGGVGLVVSNIHHLIQPNLNSQLLLLADHLLFGLLLAVFITRFSEQIIDR